jgi:hypothetical protein
MNIALQIEGFIEMAAEIEEGYMLKAICFIVFICLMVVLNSWRGQQRDR